MDNPQTKPEQKVGLTIKNNAKIIQRCTLSKYLLSVPYQLEKLQFQVNKGNHKRDIFTN